MRQSLLRFEEAHIDIINLSVQMPYRQHEHVMETLEMFAKQVMPEFHDRHAQHQKWREQQLDGVNWQINSSI